MAAGVSAAADYKLCAHCGWGCDRDSLIPSVSGRVDFLTLSYSSVSILIVRVR